MGDKLYEALGRAVRSRRELLGLSQFALAKHVGMARTSITNIESGGQNLMLHQFVEIAHALRMSPTELFEAATEMMPAEKNEDKDPQVEKLLMKLTLPVRTKKA